MNGFLHALVEDAAREAGVTVAQMLAPQVGRSRFDPEKAAAIMAAVDAGYSREQIARVFRRTKRSIVKIVSRRRPRYPSCPQAEEQRAI